MQRPLPSVNTRHTFEAASIPASSANAYAPGNRGKMETKACGGCGEVGEEGDALVGGGARVATVEQNKRERIFSFLFSSSSSSSRSRNAAGMSVSV